MAKRKIKPSKKIGKQKITSGYLLIKGLQASGKTYKEIEKITKVKKSELVKYANVKKIVDIKTGKKIERNLEKLNTFDFKKHSQNKAKIELRRMSKSGKSVKKIAALTYLSEYKITKVLKEKPQRFKSKEYQKKITYLQTMLVVSRLKEKKSVKQIQAKVKKYSKSKYLLQDVQREINKERQVQIDKGIDVEFLDLSPLIRSSKFELNNIESE